MQCRIVVVTALLVLTVKSISVPAAEINKTIFGGIAVKGYDVVAYFTDGQAVKGSKSISHEWQGAKWLFSNEEHRVAFVANPDGYAPQYGGYCAWAVSQGYTADIDPEAWRIVDGRLYLNYDKQIQAKWEKDIPGFIVKANENWPKLSNK